MFSPPPPNRISSSLRPQHIQTRAQPFLPKKNGHLNRPVCSLSDPLLALRRYLLRTNTEPAFALQPDGRIDCVGCVHFSTQLSSSCTTPSCPSFSTSFTPYMSELLVAFFCLFFFFVVYMLPSLQSTPPPFPSTFYRTTERPFRIHFITDILLLSFPAAFPFSIRLLENTRVCLFLTSQSFNEA